MASMKKLIIFGEEKTDWTSWHIDALFAAGKLKPEGRETLFARDLEQVWEAVRQGNNEFQLVVFAATRSDWGMRSAHRLWSAAKEYNSGAVVAFAPPSLQDIPAQVAEMRRWSIIDRAQTGRDNSQSLCGVFCRSCW